jgi:hypothetical protein
LARSLPCDRRIVVKEDYLQTFGFEVVYRARIEGDFVRVGIVELWIDSGVVGAVPLIKCEELVVEKGSDIRKLCVLHLQIMCSYNLDADKTLRRLKSPGVHLRCPSHVCDFILLSEVSHRFVNWLPEFHLVLDRSDWLVFFLADGEDFCPLLDQRCLTVDMSNFTLDQVFQQDFTAAHMHSRVVDTHVQVHLQTLLLQETDVEVVYAILETKLSLVVRSQTLCHLRGLRSVVIEVNSAECYERFVRIYADVRDPMDLHYNVLKKLGILNFEVEDVFVNSHFRFVGYCAEFAPDVVFEVHRPPIWTQACCGWVHLLF